MRAMPNRFWMHRSARTSDCVRGCRQRAVCVSSVNSVVEKQKRSPLRQSEHFAGRENYSGRRKIAVFIALRTTGYKRKLAVVLKLPTRQTAAARDSSEELALTTPVPLRYRLCFAGLVVARLGRLLALSAQGQLSGFLLEI